MPEIASPNSNTTRDGTSRYCTGFRPRLMATLIRPGTPSRLPPPGRDAGNCHLPDGVRLPGQDPKRGALSGHKEFQGLQRGVAFYFSFFQQAVLSNLKILSSLPSFRIRSSDA